METTAGPLQSAHVLPAQPSLRAPAGLSDTDLLAFILGDEADAHPVEAARRLLARTGGVDGLARADDLCAAGWPGIGRAGAARLLAALELGRRVAHGPGRPRHRLNDPEAVHAFLAPVLRARATERLVVLSLDSRGGLIAPAHVLEGGVRSVGARPADVLREPIVLRAASTVVAHNHPSGDPTPSPHDVALTRRLVEIGALLDLEVQDHVIVGDPGFVSMRRERLGFPRP